MKLRPEQKRTTTLPDKTRRVYRWVEQLPYIDSEKRSWTLGAILCEETSPTGVKTTFAWLTNLAVNRDSVVAIADQVGRLRQKIENEGFNVQKNSGLNLEHVFSQNWDRAKAYYYLLRSAICSCNCYTITACTRPWLNSMAKIAFWLSGARSRKSLSAYWKRSDITCSTKSIST